MNLELANAVLDEFAHCSKPGVQWNLTLRLRNLSKPVGSKPWAYGKSSQRHGADRNIVEVNSNGWPYAGGIDGNEEWLTRPCATPSEAWIFGPGVDKPVPSLN